MSNLENALEIGEKVAKKLSRKYHMDLDDCLSDAQYSIFKKIDGFNPEKCSLEGYCYLVVSSEILSRLRTTMRKAKGVTTYGDLREVLYMDNTLDDELVYAALELIAEGLSAAKVRKILRARLRAKGQTTEQIRERFGLAKAAVKPCRMVPVKVGDE